MSDVSDVRPRRLACEGGDQDWGGKPWPWPVPAATERCCLTTANVDSPRRLMAASGQRPSGVFVCCIRRCLNCTKAAALPTNSWYEHPKTRTTRSSWSVVNVRPSSGGSDPRPNRRTLEGGIRGGSRPTHASPPVEGPRRTHRGRRVQDHPSASVDSQGKPGWHRPAR